MALKLDKNEKSGKFRDITIDRNVKNYVMNQMNDLKNKDVGDVISSIFTNKTSSGSPRLFGTNSDLARADVTIKNKSVLIQIQNNNKTCDKITRGKGNINSSDSSPTYASMTVDTSVKKYLDLNDVPEALNAWEIKTQSINRMSPNNKKDLVEKVNVLVKKFNEVQKEMLNANVKGVPATLNFVNAADDNNKLVTEIADIQKNYNLLCQMLINFRNNERSKRQAEVGKEVVAGLNKSLTSNWEQSPDKKFGIGKKFSFKLTYNK